MPDELLTQWLHDPNAKPAKDLSKHDQRMIQLGWDAYQKLRLDRPDKKTAIILAILDSVEYELTHGACIVDKARVAREILALIGDIEKAERERAMSKEMIAWILKRLNGKDASDFMLAISVGKPLKEGK